MLGFSPISTVGLSDYGVVVFNAPVNVSLTGQHLTAFQGTLSRADQFTLVGFGLTAQQGALVSGWKLPALPALVTHQGNITFVTGPALHGLLMQARQGQIAIRKEVYFLHADSAQFALEAPDTKMFHSVFTPDPLEGNIFVYDEPFNDMLISEDA